jgi:predicted flap endonuclease-1-like 5' DNA nuclease
VGGGAVFFLVTRQSDLRVAEAETRVAKDLEQARKDALDADLAHRETKERLIALQLEYQALSAQQTAASSEEASSVPAASGDEQSLAASAERPVASGGIGSGISPETGSTAGSRDLKRVKGIGPAIERRLNELGVNSLADLAALSPADVDRINARLDFPGRIQREHWIEQAKALLSPPN